jgi:DNA-directed RNA polymerase specialized sigma24 family protein
MAKPSSFYDVLTEAVSDMAEHGYDSAERVAYWTERLRKAAASTMTNPHKLEEMLRDALRAVYTKLVERGDLTKFHQGVARFTIDKVRPQLRAELDRRILASANLIKLNREETIEKTLRRFNGWATSIPVGGSDAVEKAETKKGVRKALTQLPFEERRVLIDQGHKLTASLGEILAKDGGALAMRWHSHWREKNYNYREDHKERDEHVYLLRGSWAQEAGLVKPGPSGYYDSITSVGEEPFCRCYATWFYNLRDLPREMLTQRGAEQLEQVRVA